MNRVRTAAAATAALVMAGLTACSGDDEPSPASAAQEFLDAWAKGDVRGAAGRTDDPAAAQAVLQQAKEALGATKAELRAGEADTDGDAATVPFRASWTLPGLAAPWSYDGSVSLRKSEDRWTVTWSPATVHPRLTGDAELAVRRELPERAPVLDSAGQPLFARTDVVVVGIEPRLVEDLDALAATLASVLRIDAGDIVADVRKAEPDHFVPVITLRRPDYDRVRSQIHDLPGTRFVEDTRVLGPSASFAQPFLGRVGEATEEVLKEVGPGYAAGDQLGVSGLQRALNAQLSGEAGASVAVVGEGGGEGTEIGRIDARPGTPVTITLDRRVQDAADAAVASVAQNAAIVALRPSTGEILAVANGPNTTFDMAMTAKVPAGSTFKIITTAALLEAGKVSAGTPVTCPGTVKVGGRTFQNEDAFALGRVSLRTAFARSCNTTVIALGQQLDGQALVRAAGKFGVGAGWKLPVASFSGSLAPPADRVELAADSIGQGKVLVSPFTMALVAATVRRGSTPTPVLVRDQPAEPANAPQPLPGPVVDTMRDFTRAVVTEGTASALAGLPGEPVAGKTGTAEYGTDDPPRAHAWFAGYRGDLAFAVFVEDGQHSYTTAVPVARVFLSELR